MENQVTFQETIKTNKDQSMDASGDALRSVLLRFQLLCLLLVLNLTVSVAIKI